MSNLKAPRQSVLFQPEQPWVGNLIQCPVTKHFYKGLAISDKKEVVTALCEVKCLFNTLGYSQVFSLKRCSADERNRDPARVILHHSGQQFGMQDGQMQCCCSKQKVANTTCRPVRTKVGAFLCVKTLNPFTYSTDYGLFRLLETLQGPDIAHCWGTKMSRCVYIYIR